MLRGRKVTDPVVQGATAGGFETKPGLSKAWDTVGKAKSELRKIEQRLEDVDRQPLAPVLNQTGETSITDYGGLNWNRIDNETYCVPEEFASGAVVDNYGRSAYLRSKTHTTRKVSRLDGKYVEDREEREKPVKSAPKSQSNHAGQSSKPKQTNFHLQEKKYSTSDRQKSSRPVKDKHVEFSETVGFRENNVNYGGSRIRQHIPEDQSTLTDSRDIRETEIRFLNNNLTQDIELDENGRRTNELGPRLTHVSVSVPSTTRAAQASAGYSGAGNQKQGPTSSRSHFLDLVPDSPEMDGRTSDCSSFSDSESSRRRRIKGDIRKIDPDGLAKIRETIQKQIKSKEPRENVNASALDGEDPDEPVGSGHQLHDPAEPLVPRSQDLIDGAEKTAKVRKVAQGPAAPTYKGFSEAEVRYRLVENKVPKSHDASRKDKKRQVSLKLQDKRSDPVGTWLTVEDGEGKTKKVTRVIAPSRRPNKQQPQPKHKEIITTSSWRAGQELILRELGPIKSKKSRSRDRDTNSDLGHDDPAMEERPEALGGEEYPPLGGATAAEIQHHRNLSAEARRVYNDLQLEDEHDDSGGGSGGKKKYSEKKRKATTKRKAPKVTGESEFEKQQASSAKQRHYDQEQIRRYMQKQKAERVRQQREAELRMREEEEARRRHLEELYNKQKQASITSATHARKERSKKGQGYESMPTMSAGELPRHHPFHTERTRFVVSSDSENKENHHHSNVDDDEMEVSDSSSTITGDGSMEDLTPTGTPRRAKVDFELPGPKQNVLNKASKQKTSSKPLENSSNVKTIGDFTFNVDGVMSKFSQALHEKLNEEPRSLETRGAYGGSSHQDNFRSLPADLNRNDGAGLSQADRIQAIKETAATLQSRLKQEALKIQAQASNIKPAENGATSRAGVRWQDREPTTSSGDREEQFMTRYERVTGAKDDFTVFKSNLPGNQAEVRWPDQDSRKPAGSATANAPASSGAKNYDIGEDTTITETSTFSEITLTDESDNDDFLDSGNKIGTGLQQRDFHVGSKTVADKPAALNIPRPAHNPPRVGNSWEDPSPDEYNVFSIYSRRQQERVIRPGREPMFQRKPEEEPQIRATQASAAAQAPRAATSTAAPRARSPGLSQRTESVGSRRVDSPVDHKSESLRTQSPVDKSRSRQVSASARVDQGESDEDTVEEDVSYTQTFETEEKSAMKSKSVSEKLPRSHRSLPSAGKSASKASERVTPQPGEEESSMDEEISQDEVTPRAERLPPSEVDPSAPARMSPNSLERRFYTEFHNLESMELSLKQLTGVERTRAVALAQQETVSLAQMLKARQQGYDQKMAEIQIKAQLEATEATKQLEDARKRASDAAINAADMIAKVRGEGVSAIQDSTRKLIDTQTKAAKATAEAAKFLSEARALGIQDTNRLAVETAASAAASAVNTALDKKWQKPYPKTPKRRSDEARDQDDLESVGSVDDYSVAFDDSMTEDEREEKSFRAILPSESHRKKGRHIQSDNESVTSEGSTKTVDSDFQSIFKGQESFDKFTDEMVRKFMKEEEMRAQHQTSLLKLREEALIEKSKAELQWLEQQKQRIRNKGSDDSFPQIVKRQRGLKMKLQEQQAEIKRLRDANNKAAKERRRQLAEEISKRKASQKGQPQPTGRLGRHHEVHTEAEVSSIDEASDAEKQRKDYKSDSEIYTEPGSRKSRSKAESRHLEKYKKINLDEKYLTQRQSKLMDRRKNAEELLKWKKMLDQEENRVLQLEKKALKVWDKKDNKAVAAAGQSVPGPGLAAGVESREKKEPATVKEESEAKVSSKLSISKKDNGTTKDSTIRTAVSSAQDSTIISENISTARDESLYTSIKESIPSAAASSESSPDEIHRRRMHDKSNLKAQNRSGSESSEIQSVSSMEDSKKQNDSSDDTMTHSYGNETFDETTATKKTSKSLPSPKSPLDKLKKALPSPRNSPRSLFSPRSHARNSESESEESISLTESQSELSDFEGRIRALNEELRRRKTEADRLKRERKKKRKETMKDKEETLKKQIEAYDNQIAQLKVELKKESTEPAKTTVRPQIKHPKVSPPKAAGLKKTEVTTPARQKLDTDSSGPDSTQVSPEIQLDKDLKQTPPKSIITPPPAKISLDKISEGSESFTPTKSERSEATYREKPDSRGLSHKSSGAEDDKTEEDIVEEISVATEASEDRSQEIKIDLNTREKEDIYDVSVYTDDTFEHYTESAALRQPLSARSYTQISEAESKNIPLSARSESEEISEQISAALPSVSASESFIKPLDLKTFEPELAANDLSEKSEKEIESDLDNSPRSIVESSRPSSGERSIPESEDSERLPVEKGDKKEKEDLEEHINEPSWLKKKPSGLIHSAMADIDDLLGLPDEDDEDEDLTPVQSLRETPRDTEENKDLLGERQEGDGEAQMVADILSDFEIGDRVSVTGLDGERCTGILLFKGCVKFAPGVWAGVELDTDNGRHNGEEGGQRYFNCKENHGLLVPADDLMAAPEEQEPMFFDPRADVRSSIESVKSVSSVNSESEELMKAISESDKLVQEFMENSESPVSTPRNEEPDNKTRKERLADKITEDLFQTVLKENVGTISDIASKQEQRRRGPPPVAPKPKRKQGEKPVLQNGDLDELEAFLQPEITPPTAAAQSDKNIDNNARVTANNLMNDAIDHMLSIRHNRQNQDKDHSRDSGNFTDGVEDEHQEAAVSPTDELQGVLDKQDEDVQMDTPPRPGSPIPGLKSHVGGHKPVEDSGNFEGEYEEDLPWGTPSKSPPPYPASEHELSRPEMKKMAEELFYAVPHQTEEVNGIVSSAVDEYWTQRRYGEPLDTLQPSDSYFSQEESGSDLISNSKRVFKKLLFDLTGEIIRNIYREEDYDPPVAWHKPKRKQCKFYKGARPPTTVDVLKPVVQQGVIDILGLNGARKPNEKNKWGVRKKKDLVDTILVQELREEEPDWVNYDDDELAVKMQLTETIFENLLTDTVQTINKIYRKKQSFMQRETSK